MTVELTLPPETEAKLRQQAALTGQGVHAFVLEAISEKLAAAETAAHEYSATPEPDVWQRKLQNLIDRHPVVTHFVDDSREANQLT